MLLKIVTIGAYGFTETSFFSALELAQVDTFCDLRFRRGVRGPEYAFVNSKRLQRGLAEAGKRYLHFRQLAPSPSLRRCQASADKAQRIGKRQRGQLSPEFVSGYQHECLDNFDSGSFVAQLGQSKVAALFCVEREPAACHRLLVAERLTADLKVELAHLVP
jgi:hypothetical protein